MGEAHSCCGFGGAFAAKFAAISTAMGEVKAASASETKAEYIVSADSSCLMHLAGLLERQKSPIKCLHLAEVPAHRFARSNAAQRSALWPGSGARCRLAGDPLALAVALI